MGPRWRLRYDLGDRDIRCGWQRVAVRQDEYSELTDGSGPQTWGGWVAFQATWAPGEYTAEVRIHDNMTGKGSEPGEGTFTIADPEPKLEILSVSQYSGQYDVGVRGVARNASEETLAYAEVSAVFLNSDGQQVGDGLDNASDLAPGREWQFDCAYLGEEDFASYELAVDWRI